MAYGTECSDLGIWCQRVARFSTPDRYYEGDSLGSTDPPRDGGRAGPADAVGVMRAEAAVAARYRDPEPATNLPPRYTGVLPSLDLLVDTFRGIGLSAVFFDPNGDPLRFVAYDLDSVERSVDAWTVRNWLYVSTSDEVGSDLVRVTATDIHQRRVTHEFLVTVKARPDRAPLRFTDPTLVPGVTPVRAAHFQELRDAIDTLLVDAGWPAFEWWTDPVLTPGVTPIKSDHYGDLTAAIDLLYLVLDRPSPFGPDYPFAFSGDPIRAWHIEDLRRMVLAVW